MAVRVLHRTSRTFRRLLVLVVMAGAAVFGWSFHESRKLQKELSILREAMARADDERRSFAARVDAERMRSAADRGELQGQIEEYRRQEAALRGQLADAAGRRGGLAARRAGDDAHAASRRWRAERAAGETIIRQYGGGVCLIQGSYAFYDGSDRPLRVALDDNGRTAARRRRRSRPRRPRPRARSTRSSSTARASWWTGAASSSPTATWRSRGGTTTTRRGAAEGAASRPRHARTRARSSRGQQRRLRGAGGAALRRGGPRAPARRPARRAASPCCRSSARRRAPCRASRWWCVGYPAGLEAILAKAETSVVQQHPGAARHQLRARHRGAEPAQGLIRPSTTQGHIGDVTRTDIVFDAPTTQGGSGGPVFNKHGQVVAVEYAVLPKFGGNSFGVPDRLRPRAARRRASAAPARR